VLIDGKAADFGKGAGAAQAVDQVDDREILRNDGVNVQDHFAHIRDVR
jgi:hypothetical protein